MIIISNRNFEMRLLNMLITEESLKSDVFLQGQCDGN